MDDFYRWASLRSSYLAEANVDQARRYAARPVVCRRLVCQWLVWERMVLGSLV